ncbi:MAG: hypothetical protein OEO83_08725, partial [Alphaproteobacteria bacterium]|nr:hypothetical protein [Alphaproteobacteria bacterium]
MARAARGKSKRQPKPAAKNATATVEVAVKTRKRNRPEYGSDAVAELLSRYGFEYAFLNPGSSYR